MTENMIGFVIWAIVGKLFVIYGICFVIHHANPYQIYYEEDILEHRDDIIGHYRIS